MSVNSGGVEDLVGEWVLLRRGGAVVIISSCSSELREVTSNVSSSTSSNGPSPERSGKSFFSCDKSEKALRGFDEGVVEVRGIAL